MFEFEKKKRVSLVSRKTSSFLGMVMWIFVCIFCFLFVSWKLGLLSLLLAVYYGYDWNKQKKKELNGMANAKKNKKARKPVYDETDDDMEQAEYF